MLPPLPASLNPLPFFRSLLRTSASRTASPARSRRAPPALTRACAAVLATCALASVQPAFAQPAVGEPSDVGREPAINVTTVLPPSVMAGLAEAHVPLSSFSAVIEKIGDRQPSLAVNAGQPMKPASTMKLVTTYTGLSLLGPDYRWRTSAYTTGQVDAAGVLHGDLYIKGTGDPKLVPEQLVDLVQKIRAAGISRIDGALVLDKSEFDPSTRDLPPFDGDASAPYNVGPDPLLYAYKSLVITTTPSRTGVEINVLPPLAQLRIDNRLRLRGGACTGVDLTPQITHDPDGAITATFSGPYPIRCGERGVNMAAPLTHSEFFAGGFLALWQQAGGSFGGTVREGVVPPDAHLVAVHESPPLADVVHEINKLSNNTMARNLFLTLGAVEGKPPSTPDKAADVVRAFLHRSGIDMPELILQNGCGLSDVERVSALSLANLLQAANASPVAQPFIDSLPVPGVDGTMRHRLVNEPIEGKAHIKTGTLRDVRAVAGYVAAANGETYVVVSIINGPHAEAARAAHDSLLEWVYQGMPEERPVTVEAHPKRVPHRWRRRPHPRVTH
ncbi:D-alanyl-D-alanine carboxypeptidase/D-alanyl-D-alanine-endopeptidase [Burkholderia sp. WAC0059]|uniref:D-alanyl-D-alanine carboxypeptidase/D-alanyl-D-alanine endopeptidase n=1 Tax=Burkholderia sp. WAC0059 TaxID=2066022 RepID=UPI000C7EBE1D|nr:D-alanyl-D-alanine carboxypeptidase/D-alanyl-D-alanine-endopeptidase [Burkholderia sp. WAC0059]PLZ00810.1 D-alanyl-D-alanine carboxypeptidase/D-alanyl-D-alanine-endopeptidase [Burkholderia sp. WAC0059]